MADFVKSAIFRLRWYLWVPRQRYAYLCQRSGLYR